MLRCSALKWRWMRSEVWAKEGWWCLRCLKKEETIYSCHRHRRRVLSTAYCFLSENLPYEEEDSVVVLLEDDDDEEEIGIRCIDDGKGMKKCVRERAGETAMKEKSEFHTKSGL